MTPEETERFLRDIDEMRHAEDTYCAVPPRF
jgi:hypothetical protein